MVKLNDLKIFDFDAATVSLWVFRSTTISGIPSFTGRWIALTDDLDQAIKKSIRANTASITETLEYDLLAQNNEGSALTIPTDETFAHFIIAQAANEVSSKQVLKISHLENIKFYAVKLVNTKESLFAVRKSDDSWKTKKSKGFMRAIYSNDRLDIDTNPSFNISQYFDFYLLSSTIFISSKASFESVLSYRQKHVESFQALQEEDAFSDLFQDMAPILEYVGSNKIQLRRIMAIQQKGHYKDINFMSNLRRHCDDMGFNIKFTKDGKIIPTKDNCHHIFKALLNHRLDSRLSQEIFDVQSTSPIS